MLTIQSFGSVSDMYGDPGHIPSVLLWSSLQLWGKVLSEHGLSFDFSHSSGGYFLASSHSSYPNCTPLRVHIAIFLLLLQDLCQSQRLWSACTPGQLICEEGVDTPEYNPQPTGDEAG